MPNDAIDITSEVYFFTDVIPTLVRYFVNKTNAV